MQNNNKYTRMDKLAEYRERMEWAKEHKDKANFMKYYELYKKEYEKLSGKNFDEEFGKEKCENGGRDDLEK